MSASGLLTVSADPMLAGLMLSGLLLSGSLLAIAWIDARSLRIPDALSLPLIAAGLVWAALQPDPALVSHLMGAVVGYAVLALIGEVYFRKSGTEGLGLGDAKLFAAGGAWLGWQALPAVLLIAAGAGLLFALLRRSGAQTSLPFGPWLALGIWLVWIGQTTRPLTAFGGH